MVVRKVQRLYVHHLVSDKAALLESLQRAAPEGEVADNGALLRESSREFCELRVVVQGKGCHIQALVAVAGILYA